MTSRLGARKWQTFFTVYATFRIETTCVHVLGGEPAGGKGALLPEAGGQPQGPGGGRSEADGEGEGGAPEEAGAAGDTAGEQLSGQPGQKWRDPPPLVFTL